MDPLNQVVLFKFSISPCRDVPDGNYELFQTAEIYFTFPASTLSSVI